MIVREGGKKYYVHELCATWCPEVYLNFQNKYLKFLQGYQRSQKNKCSHCGLLGAGIGCQIEECHQNYHYDCVRQAGGAYVRKKFIIYCANHLNQRAEEDYDSVGSGGASSDSDEYLC